ncbi:MAG: nitroreductase family protein, partial [Eubacteriales bacterium]
VDKGEKLCAATALGYGQTNGVPHKSKPFSEVASADEPIPAWFRSGVEAALLAPTAMNQQKFRLTLCGNRVIARAGTGFYTKLDLGIVKYHFEIGAGSEPFEWG